jgi:serine protease
LLLSFSGVNNFETKGLNCAASGGIAAVIYNNVTDNNAWALPATTKVKIPVFQLSLVHGNSLKVKSLNTDMTISTKKGYSFLSGTSMASPHVTGVISRLWRTVSLHF